MGTWALTKGFWGVLDVGFGVWEFKILGLGFRLPKGIVLLWGIRSQIMIVFPTVETLHSTIIQVLRVLWVWKVASLRDARSPRSR